MRRETETKIIIAVQSLRSIAKKTKKIFYFIGILGMLHIFLSVWLKDFAWLASYGGILAIFGLIVSFSYSFPIEDLKEEDKRISTDPNEQYITGGITLGCVIDGIEQRESLKDKKVAQNQSKYDNLGAFLLITISGAILSSYSGHLNKIMGWGVTVCTN